MNIPALPTTVRELNGWFSALLGIYLVLAYGIHLLRCYLRSNYSAKAEHAKKLFDGVTFSGSTMLLIGVLYDSRVLDLIGDTTFYLVIGGVAGIGYAVRALFPPWA